MSKARRCKTPVTPLEERLHKVDSSAPREEGRDVICCPMKRCRDPLVSAWQSHHTLLPALIPARLDRAGLVSAHALPSPSSASLQHASPALLCGAWCGASIYCGAGLVLRAPDNASSGVPCSFLLACCTQDVRERCGSDRYPYSGFPSEGETYRRVLASTCCGCCHETSAAAQTL